MEHNSQNDSAEKSAWDAFIEFLLDELQEGGYA